MTRLAVTLYTGGKPQPDQRRAEHAAQRAGTPETGYAAFRREDGTYIPVVLLRDDQWWMSEHINVLGAVAYPAAYDLPTHPGHVPTIKDA